IWSLPLGRGHKLASGNAAISGIVSGWQVNNVISLFDGTPFNVSGNCDPSWPGNSPTMVDIVKTPNKIGNRSGFWYDPTAFADVLDPNSPGDCRQSLGNSGFNNL